MKYFKAVASFVVVGFLALIIVGIFSHLGKIVAPKKANADSLDVYPGVCLGGWQNPGNAAGAPDVQPGGDSFGVDNSAVLNQADAQILCGSFQGSDQSQTPTAVTLHLSWSVIFASEDSSSDGTSTDGTDWSSVLDATSTNTSTPAVAPSSTPTAASSTDTDDSDVNDQGATSTDASTSAPVQTSTPSVTPPPDQSVSDQSSTSLLQNIFGGTLGFLVERSFADTTDTTDASNSTDVASTTIDTSTIAADTSGNNFIDVSYSLDGTTWIDLGPVSESDWQNYSVTIPVSSWSDINNLQIQLSPMISADPPTIYLDGMWLEVDYDGSILSDIENALSDVLPTDTLSTSTAPQDANTQNPPAAPQATPAPPAPPAPPAHQYMFSLQGTQSIKVGNLAWAPADVPSSTAAAGAPTGQNTPPTVSLPATNTIQISGTCTSAYYTILIFAHPDDYQTDPSLALLNEANPCVNGSFSQTISDTDLPPKLASGTYYLMVANQGTKGPWQPYPVLYPVTLDTADNAASSSSQ